MPDSALLSRVQLAVDSVVVQDSPVHWQPVKRSVKVPDSIILTGFRETKDGLTPYYDVAFTEREIICADDECLAWLVAGRVRAAHQNYIAWLGGRPHND